MPERRRVGSVWERPWVPWITALVAPVLVAAALVPGRGHLAPSDDALVLVAVTVAVGGWGRRGPAALCALVAAASFDVLLTRPYGSFRIGSTADLTTELLFVAVGLLVGELAARGRRHRREAAEGREGLARIRAVADQLVGGEDPEFVVISVASQLRELLHLRDCRFVREGPSGRGAWIGADGSVHLNPLTWPADSVGLPTDHVELAVRGGGRTVGTFILTPTPGEPVSDERCVAAVALADQLGTALAGRPQGPAGPAGAVGAAGGD